MRLWSLHPKYLDTKGLVACWREGLLARKVLLGETRGYRNHPQLERFRNTLEPVNSVDTYLTAIYDEAVERRYKFDRAKIGVPDNDLSLTVTIGQLLHELEYLRGKLESRDPSRFQALSYVEIPLAHPLFSVIDGAIESWERPASIRRKQSNT